LVILKGGRGGDREENDIAVGFINMIESGEGVVIKEYNQRQIIV